MRIKKILLAGLASGAIVAAVILAVGGRTKPVLVTENAIMPEFTPQQMAQQSAGVVLGTVTGLEVKKAPAFDDPGYDEIVTNVSLHVDEWLLNPSNKSERDIVVQVVGGTLGNETTESEESPKFSEGEQAIVFLNDRKPGKEYTVFGWLMGKFGIGADQGIGQGKEKETFTRVFGQPMNVSRFRESLRAWDSEIQEPNKG